MSRGRLACLTAALCCVPVLAAEPVAIEDLPVNRWIERPVTGLKGDAVTDRGGLAQGVCYVPEAQGLVAVGDLGRPAALWRLDLDAGQWKPFGGVPADLAGKRGNPGYQWSPLKTAKAADGQVVPMNALFHGNQVCYDPDRHVIVGFTRGRTVEYDLKAKRWRVPDLKDQPASVTAASLAYDPVNKEMVLAVGGFAPEGHPHGTWVYRAAEGTWAKVPPPTRAFAAVGQRAEALAEKARRLRASTWKNIEFRLSDREALLTPNETTKGLAAQADALPEAAKVTADEAARAPDDAAVQEWLQRRLDWATEPLKRVTVLQQGLAKAVAGTTPAELETVYRERIAPLEQAAELAAERLRLYVPPRMSARVVYDAKRQQMLCFGGDRQDGIWGDTWVYRCASRTWWPVEAKVHPSPRFSRAMAYDPENGVVVLITSRWRDEIALETWVFGADEKPAWRQLAIPSPDGAFWVNYDGTAKCLVALSQHLNRCWVMRLDPDAAEARGPKPAPEVDLRSVEGEFVLRDAATAADLAKWARAFNEWKSHLPANTWVVAPTHGTGRPNWGRSWSSIVYDPARQQLLYRGGGHGSYHGSVTDHYDIPTGRWYRSERQRIPGWPMGKYFAWGRSFSYGPWATHTYKFKYYWNPLTRTAQRTGVPTATPQDRVPGQMAVADYDPDLGRWRRNLAHVPAVPGGGTFVIPTEKGVGCVPFGRRNANVGVAHVVTKDGVRTLKGVGGHSGVAYPPWEFQVGIYDPKRHRVLRMGPGHPPDEVWALPLEAPGAKWRKLPVKSDPLDLPLPETGREMVYLPEHDLFVMPDGRTRSSYRPDKVNPRTLQELCVLDPKTNTWRRFAAKLTPETQGLSRAKASGRSIGMAYDPRSDLIFLIGGIKTRAHWSGLPILCAMRFDPERVDWLDRTAWDALGKNR